MKIKKEFTKKEKVAIGIGTISTVGMAAILYLCCKDKNKNLVNMTATTVYKPTLDIIDELAINNDKMNILTFNNKDNTIVVAAEFLNDSTEEAMNKINEFVKTLNND